MDKYIRANRDLWNMWAPLHVESEFYDVEGFKAGRPRRRHGLDVLETTLLGNVTGKSLLHLQCHFGLDTITWAQRGAAVTGVDFAEKAIAAAQQLAGEMGVPARFICSNVYDLPAKLDEQYDIVFTSHGVLGWLPDLERWASVVAHHLKPGGTLCVIEAHPFALLFDDHRTDAKLLLLYPYFHGPEPFRDAHTGSYAAPDAPIESVEHFWLHTMSDILGSLVRAGLRLTSFQEYPFVAWPLLPWMEERSDGAWQLPGGRGTVPLMFSLLARKD